jgi:hypothetical protein
MIGQEFSRDNSDGVGRIEGKFLGAWSISINRVMSCVSFSRIDIDLLFVERTT